jgi:hypothetical protein
VSPVGCRAVVEQCGPRSLVLLDELGKGTEVGAAGRGAQGADCAPVGAMGAAQLTPCSRQQPLAPRTVSHLVLSPSCLHLQVDAATSLGAALMEHLCGRGVTGVFATHLHDLVRVVTSGVSMWTSGGGLGPQASTKADPCGEG